MVETTRTESLPARFGQIVERHGDRIALSTDAVQWTYRELDRLSDTVAHGAIERLGSDSSVPVALVMDHGAPLIAAVLGVLKAGKIYLVIDPLDPASRLRAILADAGVALVLADGANLELARSVAPDGVPVVEPVFEVEAGAPKPDRPLPALLPGSGALLAYTSGSTGIPKGVWHTHAGLLDHTDIFADLIEAGPGDRFSLLTSLSLFASTSATFGALLHGATLCPFRVRTEGVERLALWLQQQGITVYHSVPTIFRHLALASKDNRHLQSLRLLRLGGEPIRASDVELYRKHCQDTCRLMLSLSSTESGLIAASLIDKQTRLPEGVIPAGYPVPGVDLQILDQSGNPVPSGDEGRIAVRSVHVARGYWRQPEATAQVFQPDENDPEIRRFLSNDLGRILEDGSLLHLGRADQVVKIRGRRVDLLEVEENLSACALIKEAAAAAAEDARGDNRLIGYVVLKPGVGASGQDLRQALAHIPEHLIPSSFVFLDRLPQVPGGKLDRKALAALAPRPGHTPADGEPPLRRFEQGLALIWETVFGISPIGRHADFFELGGSSIQSVRMLALIADRFNVVLPPSVLVEYSTIETLARLIADQRLWPSSDPLIRLCEGDDGRPLFLVHSGEGDLALYGQLVRRLPGRAVYGFQSIGLEGDRSPLRSVESMAKRYLEDVVRSDPTGPYLIGGTRMGGKVALEMARQLTQQRSKVALLALFDFSPPRDPRYYDILVNPVRKTRDLMRIGTWAAVRRLRRNDKNRWLESYRSFVASMNCGSRHDYRMKHFAGTITLILTKDRVTRRHDTLRRYADEVRTIMIPCARHDLLRPPAVDIVARELQTCIGEAESNG